MLDFYVIIIFSIYNIFNLYSLLYYFLYERTTFNKVHFFLLYLKSASQLVKTQAPIFFFKMFQINSFIKIFFY